MAQIFPIDFEEKLTMAQDDYILFSDSEDGNKIKKAQYSNLKGETGNAATVCVGSTTTGAAGTCACVTNSGDCHNAVLNFTIPKGDKGDTGQTGPAIVCAEFSGDDINFTEEDGNVVVLSCAKTCLKGDKGDTGCTGPSGTISVGTTTTLAAGCCATVSNSGTSTAAVFNFGIPKGDKGDTGATGCTGPQGPSGTITIGSTTTLEAGCCATVTNSGTCCAAVFNFGIPKGDTGDTGAAGNGIACVTSTKAGKITTVDITCTNGCSYCFDIFDGEDGQGSGDMLKCVYDPNNCETDAFNYNNMYNKLTAGSGINITANAISTASNFGTSSTAAATVQKEVSIPGITTLNVGQVVHILPSATSTVANSTLKVNSFDAYPMRYNNAAITTSTDSIVRPANIVTTFVFDGTYWQFVGHGLDSNTTYSNMGASEAVAGTCASARTISACNLKCAIQAHAPISDSAYGSGWDGGTSAPTQNAVYDKIEAVVNSIPTDNCQLINGCGYTTCTGTITGICMNGASKGTSGVVNLGTVITAHQNIKTVNNQTITGTGNVSVGTLCAETVVSGDSGTTYTIKVSNTAPGAGTPATTITFVTE